MPILCYQISGPLEANERSTTGAANGHVAAVIKRDHEEAAAQVYSELAANRLASFLGIPVVAGVAARDPSNPDLLRFAALRAADSHLDIYDFSADPMDEASCADIPPQQGMLRTIAHPTATQQLCAKYPVEAAHIAVFDLWICNLDRDYNFKAELNSPNRGIIFAMDQGSSLLACRSTVAKSLEALQSTDTPSSHPFQSLVDGRLCGQMVERILSLPDWALEAATTYDDTIGNVILPDQYTTYEALSERRKHLGQLVDRILLRPA